MKNTQKGYFRVSSEELGRPRTFLYIIITKKIKHSPIASKEEGRLLHPACSPPRAGGAAERCSGQQQRSQHLSHTLCDKYVSGMGQRAPSAWELLCEEWEPLFVGLLLPPTCISGQSNPCLNCSSAALLRESKDSLLEMDVVLPLGVAMVLLTPSV